MLKNISILRGYMGEGVIILIRGLLCNYWGFWYVVYGFFVIKIIIYLVIVLC